MRARELFVCRPMKVAVSMVVAILMLSSLRLQAQTASAVVPFQGQLASQSGEPISPPKPLTLAFRLYENPVGGVALWEEIQPNIVVIAGRFNALLGSRNPFPDLKIFNRTVYLGITIDDGDPTTADVEMRPRQAIVPVISAISARNSDKLNGHDWSDLLVGGSDDPSSSRIRTDKLDLSSLQAKIETLTQSLEQEQASIAALASNLEAVKTKNDTVAKGLDDVKGSLVSSTQKLQSALAAIGTDGDQGQRAFARGRGNQNYACPPGQFVSAIAATEWNSDHNDAIVANIGVQCRKALVGNSDKQ